LARDTISATVEVTQAYYDGPADEIYRTIWGDNIHMGIPPFQGATLHEAMDYTNRVMADAASLKPGDRVLDLGCGYGSTARYIAKHYGCTVIGTNISENELALARERAEEARLSHLLTFEYGDFHDVQYPDNSFDVVWSQEAFLHGADKDRILAECYRVLKPGGTLIFSDILVRRDTPQADRERLYDRLKTTDIWDLPDYQDGLTRQGFEVLNVEDHSQCVAPTYGAVVSQVREHRSPLANRIGEETVANTINALDFWVQSANDGKVGWGIFLARKPR
jgi:cyclopropane fatty-acyl-phospholipid synthase-like methyltransferase